MGGCQAGRPTACIWSNGSAHSAIVCTRTGTPAASGFGAILPHQHASTFPAAHVTYFLRSPLSSPPLAPLLRSLTLTPIVIYFSKATGVDPLPYLFAEYAAANTFGALLYTGRPLPLQ